VNLTSQCDTSVLVNRPRFASPSERILNCSNQAINYASDCTVSVGDIYRRDLKCINKENGSEFQTVSMQLDDDLVEACEEYPVSRFVAKEIHFTCFFISIMKIRTRR